MANTINIKEKKAVSSHVTTKTDVLTLQVLQDMVLDGIQRCRDHNEVELRNFEETRQLLNFLFENSIKQLQLGSGNEEEIANIIKTELNADNYLLGYTHYICDSDTNPYNWRFLLENRNRYANFLYRFMSHIVWVTKDMNALLSSLSPYGEMIFLIDGYLEVKIKNENEKKTFEANVNLEEISRIYSVSESGYRLSVKYNGNVLGVFWREHNMKLNQVIDFIKDGLCRYENI